MLSLLRSRAMSRPVAHPAARLRFSSVRRLAQQQPPPPPPATDSQASHISPATYSGEHARSSGSYTSGSSAGGSTGGAKGPFEGKPRKRHWFRNLFLTATLLFGGGYAGAIYLSLHNDDFYYYFTSYVPLAGLVVDSVDDIVFRQRMRGRNSPSAFVHPSAQHSAIVNVDGNIKATPAQTSSSPAPVVPASKPKGPPPSATPTGGAAPSGGSAASGGAASGSGAVSQSKTHYIDGSDHVVGASPKPAAITRVSSGGAPVLAGMDTSKLDDSLKELGSTLNMALKVHNIELKDNALFSSLAASLQAASDELQAERKRVVRDTTAKVDAAAAEARESGEAEYVKAKLNLVKTYNARLAAAMDAVEQKAAAVASNKLRRQHLDLNEQFEREVVQRVDSERDGRLSGLSELKTDFGDLQQAMLSSGAVLESSDGVVNYFVQLENLRRKLDEREAVSLDRYLRALTTALPNDPLVAAAVAAVPQDVRKDGVLSHVQLAARFAQIEPEIRRASLAPRDAGIAGHLGSLVASTLLVPKEGLPEGNDVESIVARARTNLQQGEVLAATAEINRLDGPARLVASTWLDEARKRSEMEFLVNVLSDEGRLFSVSKK